MTVMRRMGAVFFAALAGCATTGTMDDGVIFTGGVVEGASQTRRSDYAVYVDDGIIRDVGPATEITTRHRGARIVATNGTILPGFVDAHAHLHGLGSALDRVSLTGTASLDEVIARVRERATNAAAGEWILGRGWDQNDWAVKEFPHSRALDAVISDRPVWLERIDGHAGYANSAAMRAAGITRSTPDPSGGRIVRDASGEATGVFIDEAMNLIDRVVPPVTYEQRKRRVLAAAENIAR
ncbi:MAG TPA: amidohydrolase family protein, partial [Thermoanaerobaculia bacterium]